MWGFRAVLPFALLPAAALSLVIDEVVRLAGCSPGLVPGLPTIPRRFVVRLALGWALIINFLSTSAATVLPGAILEVRPTRERASGRAGQQGSRAAGAVLSCLDDSMPF